MRNKHRRNNEKGNMRNKTRRTQKKKEHMRNN